MLESKKKKDSSESWFCKYNLLGVALIAFGISSQIFLPDYIHKQMMQNLEIRPDSRPYPEWKKPTVPLYLDIYIFNWTNSEDIKNTSTKPILNQLGPYRFRDYPDKHNITFHDNNATVSYKKSNLYYFEPEMSNGTLDDIIVTVNLPAVGAAYTAQYWNSFKQFGISSTLKTFGEKLEVVKTVREMLFDGYSDPLLTIGTIFTPDATKFDSVGFMVKKNGTDIYSGKYTVHTGVDNISELGKIKKFNDRIVIPNFQGECRKLKGSPGEFYPPERNVKDTVFLFTPEMCKTLPYEYQEDRVIHGIKGNHYILGKRAVDNGTEHKENKCYFQREVPSGIWNITDCAYGSPFYMSYPHFYMADRFYTDPVEGLNPQKELHQSYMTLDEKLSITLETVARFQTNVMLQEYGSISLFKGVPKILMPLFFVEQKFIIDENNAKELYYGLLVSMLSRYAGFPLIFLGILLIVCRRISCCRKSPEIQKNPPEACALVT